MDWRGSETRTEYTRTAFDVLGELFTNPFRPADRATSTAPHIRCRSNVSRLLLIFVLASAPALLVGLWSLGVSTLESMTRDQLSGLPDNAWRIFTTLGFDATSDSVIGALLLGLAYFLPLLVVTLAVGIFWEVLFATVRRRAVDPGWLMACWLYALMLPAMLPLGMTALGISFGLVFGKHIFGGTGRYIASPALLGVLFLKFGYPGYFAGSGNFLPLPELAAGTTWASVVGSGLSAAAESGVDWFDVFLGLEIGAPGTVSTLSCLAGAALLIYTGAASARTITGAFAGLIVAAALVNTFGTEPVDWQLPWYWHIALGTFTFGVVFVATDPTPAPMTTAGRWIQGALVGVLTVLIRTYNPAHPDGTLYAILLAALATPVIDDAAIRVRMARWQRRWTSES